MEISVLMFLLGIIFLAFSILGLLMEDKPLLFSTLLIMSIVFFVFVSLPAHRSHEQEEIDAFMKENGPQEIFNNDFSQIRNLDKKHIRVVVLSESQLIIEDKDYNFDYLVEVKNQDNAIQVVHVEKKSRRGR